MNEDVRESENTFDLYGDEPGGIPFGAPGFMYAFFSFLFSAGLTWLSDYTARIHDVLPLLCLIPAAMFFVESILLLFFEPSLTLNEEGVRYRRSKQSVWAAPIRLFKWSFDRTDETFSLSSCERLELDFTTVPFPLPVYPFTRPFFRITRWMLTLKTRDGHYYLMDVGPSPAAFREVIQKAREYTELPLHTPWSDPEEASEPDHWCWFPSRASGVTFEQFLTSLRRSNLNVRETEDGALELPVRNRLTWLAFGGGSTLAMIGLLVSVAAIFAGLRSGSGTPSGLFFGLLWMLSGTLLGVFSLLLLAERISPFRSRLKFTRRGMQTIHPLRRSSLIRYEDLIALRGVGTSTGPSSVFGLGKPVPCLELHSESDWFFLRLENHRDLHEMYRMTETLKQIPPVT